ncbi:MAG: cation-translocating P-type ATPase [Anaerolineae bacterium]|nr:cation-translocating P-type ATPase [Anaerolineae bacterium]
MPSLGLTSAEVAERKKRGQSNDFEARVGRTYWQIFRDNIFNLFNIVLFTLLLIVLLARDYATVIFAGFSVVTNSLLGMVQEIGAKRKLDQMASLAVQTARVWRDGELKTIPIKQIVIDDVIAIAPGDRLVVDGQVLSSDSMELDESQLTGESDAILKVLDDPLYSGSFCIAGSGLMVATQVGKESTLNKLSAIAKTYKAVLTPTQRRLMVIVEVTILVMIILVPMLFVAGYVQQTQPIEAVRNSVVFVTSLVPQGLVLVATISLTIGAVKISFQRTLIQRVNAVESLANVTVLCFDKTGTLTQNKLAVAEVIPLNGATSDQIYDDLYHYIHNLSYQNRTAGAVAEYLVRVKPLQPLIPKTAEIPFSSARKWGAITLKDQTLLMGAPERLIHDPKIIQQTTEFSQNGLRVLAFARSPEAIHGQDVSLNGQVTPTALIVMSDQIRDDIQITLNDFRQLNVGLKVISGDNPETVKAIAHQAGMDTSLVYTENQLSQLSEADLETAVEQGQVFARIEPDTKRRIVLALQKRGHYVAMVGDGVNDVPALKAANLAIVMNDGTQISKDVADIVLLNNAMSTLPLAFREGREITQTIFGTTKMFLARNFYNVLLFIFVGFMMLPFPITPVQISWAAFGTVNMPATFIAFGIIRPKYIEHFRRDVLDYLFIAGVLGSGLLALLYAVAYFSSYRDVEVARSTITLFICLFGMMIFWNVQGVEISQPRSFIDQWRVVVISGIATLLTILSFYIAAPFFAFKAPSFGLVVLITALFLLTVMLIDYGMRHRSLLHRVWMLFEREK